jgi:putative ABC transport system permease protein
VSWLSRVANVFRSSGTNRVLDDEIAFHIECRVADLVSEGMSREAAETLARRQFGNPLRVRETSRDVKVMRWLDDLVRDLRYAVRTLRRTPAFTTVVVLTLALGIGANTAIFTVANRVLFRPLPLASPDRLVQFGPVSIREFDLYRQQSRSFESLVSYTTINKTFHDGSEPERISAVAAERALFDLLGVRPLAGRTFGTTDTAQVAVASERFWKRRFAGAQSFENRTVVLDGGRYVIIGVMPETFQFPYGGTAADVWIPTELPRTESWFQRIDAAVGRVKEGVPIEAAAAELRVIGQRIEPLVQSEPTRTVSMTPLFEAVVGRSRRSVLVLLGAAAMVLLIACANVATLLLVRAAATTRGAAVRLALGAGYGRLVRQFITESTLLSLVASVVAVLVALGSIRLLMAVAGTQLQRSAEIGLDWRVFLFLLVIGIGTGIVFGLIPALVSRKSELNATLNTQGARTSRTRRSSAATNCLVVVEIALTFVLLAGTGLLLRAFLALEQAPVGIVAEHVLTLRIDTRGLRSVAAAERRDDMTAQGRYFRSIEDRVRALPGVSEAGFVTRLHIQSPGNTGYVAIPGQPPPSARRPVRLRDASAGYFRALGIPLRAGRVFSDRDEGVVVNEALVREYFPGMDPVGRVLDRGTIVGVVGDVRQNLRLPAEPELFSPLERTAYSAATLVVKAKMPPLTLVGPVRAAIREVNPHQAVFDVRTMEDVMTASHGDLNLALSLIGVFAGIAVVLAAIGIYGVLSYSVAVRRQEFDIRLALGADGRGLLRHVCAQSGRLVAIGGVMGVVGALALTQSLRALLYEVTATDPVTFTSAAILLVGVAGVACVQPARRAMAVDPLTVLRHE